MQYIRSVQILYAMKSIVHIPVHISKYLVSTKESHRNQIH